MRKRKLEAKADMFDGVGMPPTAEENFDTLGSSMEERLRAAKSLHGKQFNIRVSYGFDDRVRRLAKAERLKLGEMLESMLEAWEARGGGKEQGVVPIEDLRAGRKNQMQFWASQFVRMAIGKVAAERELSVSALIEDLLAHEIRRLDPHGGKFGVYVKR